MLQEHSLFVDRHQIYFLEGFGPTQKAPILVFLHGWGLSARAFSKTLELLTRHFHVIAPDLPNFGQSSSHKNLTQYQHYAEIFYGFFERLRLPPVHLVGQSMGGAVALSIAAHYPSQVLSLVLANSAGIPVTPNHRIAFFRSLELLDQVLAPENTEHNYELFKSFTKNLFSKRSQLFRSLLVPITDDIRPLLPQVKCPCLIAWGTKDALLPLQTAQTFQNLIPNSILVEIENGFHEWALLMPHRFIKEVEIFYRAQGFLSS